jgi:acetylornithine/succinyldiaminopimelate/putrescine aminotransferase
MVNSIKRSLEDLIGTEYAGHVLETYSFFHSEEEVKKAKVMMKEEVDFYPATYAEKLDNLLEQVGTCVVDCFNNDNNGAPTWSYKKAGNNCLAPIGTFGWYRIGENGKLYLTSKSEHYHIPLGHTFPGYKLLEYAINLGIPSATHNNTRGYITRLLEKELIRTANGITAENVALLDKLINSTDEKVLNRVINLETGSVSTEAAVKMALSRFYRLQENYSKPHYGGRIPVFLVIGDNGGGLQGNYHGTAIFTQFLRGMWHEYVRLAEKSGLFKVQQVNINDVADFKAKLLQYNRPPFKTAVFCHEIILMNYGSISLDADYLRECYRLCAESDTPVFCDEIQSCMWYEGMFLFRKFGLTPDFVSIGKGFPGGTYASSKLLVNSKMDSLNQFGALVTNGQNEISSLAYLIGMEFFQKNTGHIGQIGRYYEERLNAELSKYAEFKGTAGMGLLLAVNFASLELTGLFCSKMLDRGFDISVQTYKPNCPPAAITKIPVIASEKMIDFIAKNMHEVMDSIV